MGLSLWQYFTNVSSSPIHYRAQQHLSVAVISNIFYSEVSKLS